jgi:hypothetical protein
MSSLLRKEGNASGNVRVNNKLYMRSSHQVSCNVKCESRYSDVKSSQGISDGPRTAVVATIRARSNSPRPDVQEVDINSGWVSSL